MPDKYKLQYSGMTLAYPGWNGFLAFDTTIIQVPRNVVLSQQTGGTIAAAPMSGYDGDIITLSNTPDAGYTFNTYNLTGATLTGNQFMFSGGDVTAKGSFTQKTYTLTLQTDGHGKLVASKVTGHKGDTVTLTPSYSSYYRFNNYSQTGGSISNNTFTFGSQNATAKANFKVNNFTATGTFNALNLSRYNTTAAVTGTSNGILKAFTGSKPSNWPATNGNWNVSNASAYGIKANTTWNLARGGSLICSGWAAVRLNGANKATGNTKLTGTVSKGGASTALNCNMANNSTQGQIAVTAQLKCGSNGRYDVTWKLGSNGWTATGIAP